MPCRFPGPHPGGGKFRGIWPGGVSRPTPKGEVEGDLSRGGSPSPHRGEGSAPGGVPGLGGSAPGGGVWSPPPWNSYCCRQYASYWNAFLF